MASSLLASYFCDWLVEVQVGIASVALDFWANVTSGNFHHDHWQSPCIVLPAIRVVQWDCEIVYFISGPEQMVTHSGLDKMVAILQTPFIVSYNYLLW